MTTPRPWLTRTVIVLGAVSLLTDAATEMIIPFLPLFITDVLGASAVMVGVVEGVADAVARAHPPGMTGVTCAEQRQ